MSAKSKLYLAEGAADLARWSRPLPGVADIEAYIRCGFPKERLKERYGAAANLGRALKLGDFKVKDGRGRRAAAGCGQYIAMPKWSRTEWIVLHELAHAIHQRLPPSHTHAKGKGHGWQYASIYLDLVRVLMGKKAGKALKQAFNAHDVRFRRPKTGVNDFVTTTAVHALGIPFAMQPAPSLAVTRRVGTLHEP